MRFRNTLILGLIFVALGAYAYLVEFRQAREESKKETLFTFTPDDVRAVTLTYPDREISLEEVDGQWKLVKPVEAPADESTVKNLIRTIAECEVKKRLEDVPKDLAPFGLDKPDVVIHVKLKEKDLPAIRVGKTTPVGYSTYIQRADDPKVVLTTATFHSGMEKQARDLRDKQIVHFEDSEVRKIAVVAPDRDILLTRKGEDWQVDQPRPYAADASTVRSFLSFLRAARATDFPDENPTNLEVYGLDIPRLTITLFTGKDEDRKEILIGKEASENKVYVKTSSRPTIYEVSDWVYRDLDKGLNDFRDKTLLAFDKDSVTSVELAPDGGEPFTLRRRSEGDWKLDDTEQQVDATRADQLLSDLHSLKGYEIIDEPADLGEIGLARPKLSITLRAGENVIGTLKLGTYPGKEGGTAYAGMREGDPTVFRLREYLFTRIDKRRASFLVHTTPTPTATPDTSRAS